MKQPFPGRITAISAQARLRRHLGTRVNISIDGEYSFSIDQELAIKRELRIGHVLSEADLSDLLNADGEAKALAKALFFMGYRPRSTQEVRARLERDEWPDEVIERVLQRLREARLLHDATFAANWVENRSHSKPRGAYALRQELRQKGIARDDIEAALPDSDQENENALAALRSKLRSFEKYEGREREQKMMAFLQRRGFNFGVARAAIRALDEEEE